MLWIRRLLGDRLLGGGLAALLGYVLLLQGLVASVGQGLAAADGNAVICTPAGLATGERPSPAAPDIPGHSCCLALCQALGGPAPALPAAAGIPLLPPPAAMRPQAARPGPSLPAARSAGRLPEARAPPGPA